MPRESVISEQQLNINFVQEVQKRPCLYNFDLPTYARKDITDQAWEEVGRATNIPASACRERWRNIRGVFARTVKAPLGGKGYKKPYYLAEVMDFIRPFMRPLTKKPGAQQRPSLASRDLDEDHNETEVAPVKIEIDDDEIDREETYEDDDTERRVPKRLCPDSEEIVLNKKSSNTQIPVIQSTRSLTAESSDHVRSFVNSLIPELNEMNSTQFKSFKRRVLVLIDDIMANTSTQKPSEDEYIM